MIGFSFTFAMLACTGDKTTDTSIVTDPTTDEGCTVEVRADYSRSGCYRYVLSGQYIVVELSSI